MCVFEVKGLPDKKKYFCEIHVDDKIYARYVTIMDSDLRKIVMFIF